ncbi:MAG: DEAD/DEAH box helicase [Alphaproteobacteria bacterium]|nr:DEAD/DEAH box helicase [Alphaproteobacteria bacterium]
MTTDFSGFGLPPKLLQSLARMHFSQPTPIQAAAIPFALDGRDILGSAQTGTGKTGAFGIPLVAKLMDNPDMTALILTPTRELAAQVMDTMQQLIPVPTIKTALLIGGEAMPKQFRQLKARPRLIVGTPGRVNDHLQRGTVSLDHVGFVVLDETDRMLDMGFVSQIDTILSRLSKKPQTLLFSATLPQSIVKLSGKYLSQPERIRVGSTVAAAPNIRQEVVNTTPEKKGEQLLAVLNDLEGTAIIFVKTKYGTEKLAARLNKSNVAADALHGDLKQSRRNRVIQGFRDKKFHVLVATDVAARGLDVPHIGTVINYDLPQCPEDFIHRIGRTARAGASGQAISFMTSADKQKWNAIQKLMNPEYVAEPSHEARRGRGGPSKPWRSGRRPFPKHKAHAHKQAAGKKVANGR